MEPGKVRADGKKKGATTSTVVTVRIEDGDLEKLQVLMQVFEKSLGELIRIGVKEWLERTAQSQEFRQLAVEMKKRHEETLNELLATGQGRVGGIVEVVAETERGGRRNGTARIGENLGRRDHPRPLSKTLAR